MKLNERIIEIHKQYPEMSWLERNRLIKEKLASEVDEREAYIKRLHRLIEVSLDMSQQPELAELMSEAPKMRSYES